MIDANHLCPGCMHFWPDPSRPCEHCGFSWENRREEGRCLPVFTILAGKYLLGVKIGAGGFGITYLAMDLNEEIPVAVKEFFPVSLAERDGEQVRALPQEEGRVFREALRSFRREADLMARFCGVEGLAGYRDFVEENGTAYLVMDYIEGPTLKQYMKETCKTFSQQEAQRLMAPVLRAVETMHAEQVLHRDISPENLILGPDGKLTLIDFGAAREYSPGEEENLTVILKRGYAPEEQYHTGSRQGPWTDLYACCAVLYQMVSGILPQDAGQRKEKDRLIPLDEIPGVEVTWQFARAIEKGMTVRAVERYPSIRALRKDLGMEETESGRQQEERTVVRQPDGRRDVSRQGRQPGKTEFSGMPAGQEIPTQEKSPGEPVRQAETSKRTLPDPVWMVGLALFLVAAWIVATVLSGGRGRRTDWAGEGAASESLQTGEGTDRGDGLLLAEEEGTVWLVTGERDEESGAWYRYEYNDKGLYSQVVSGHVSAHDYAGINGLGGSMGIDDSIGMYTADFSYEFDEAARIVSAVQTSEGEDDTVVYEHWYEYYGGDDDRIPDWISCGDGQNWFVIQADEEEYLSLVEIEEGENFYTRHFFYEDGLCSVIDRAYCGRDDNADDETVRNFIRRYLEDGVEFGGISSYEISEDGEVVSFTRADSGEASPYPKIYAEVVEGESLPAEMFLMGPLEDSYRMRSGTGEGERDEYGNLLFAGTVLYEYAEYQVEDGIYTPTGRTSGSSDTAAAEEGTGGQSWENQEEEAVLSVIGVLADNGLQADSLDQPTQFTDQEAVWQALEQGLLDAITGRVKEHDFSSCALVYPSAEWISADGGIWTVAAKDMDTCWRITELLRDAGYYSDESAAGGFLASLEMGEAHAVYRESDPFLRGIMEQYLVYWEAQTGMSWEIVDE